MKKVFRRLYRYAKGRTAGGHLANFRGKGTVNLIDVGSKGDLPYPWNQNAHKIHHLLKFEPRDKSDKSPYITRMDVALWKSEDRRNFYIYKGFKGSGSSLFPQNYEYVAENFKELCARGPENLAHTWFKRSQLERTEKVFCRKLDNVLQELGQPFSYHFLKIDAQGAEYEILSGAENFLQASCVGLHLELFILPLYKGIKLFPEVKSYLEGFDFSLVKKFPAHGSFNSQHDCLFLKRGQENHVKETIREIYGL